LLELGIDPKAIVEVVHSSHLSRGGEQPSVDERFRSHNEGPATSE
jgi:hypothetical protein